MMNQTVPIRPGKCHCGNVTESGLYRKDAPGGKSQRPCCLICRCDEHSKGFRKTDTLPGCGPGCIFHHEDVRQERLSAVMQNRDN